MDEKDELIKSTDARRWADTFCKIFVGKAVSDRDVEGLTGFVDPGVMAGWFANAIEAGRSASGQESVESASENVAERAIQQLRLAAELLEQVPHQWCRREVCITLKLEADKIEGNLKAAREVLGNG